MYSMLTLCMLYDNMIIFLIDRTPGVLFVMDLINDGDKDISVDLLFNYPDQGIVLI